MSDLISKSALIKAIEDHCEAVSIGNKAYEMAHRHIIELVEIQPTVCNEFEETVTEE